MCVVNAWLLYRRVNACEPYLPLVDFKILISEVLCEVKKNTLKRKRRPTAEEKKTQRLIDNKKKEDHALNYQLKTFVWMVWIIIHFMTKEVAASIRHVKIKLCFIVLSVSYLYVLITKEIVFYYFIHNNLND